MDIVCTHHSDHVGRRLDREQLYWELSHETYGVTQLGSFTLDRNSLHVNGEELATTMISFPVGFVLPPFL